MIQIFKEKRVKKITLIVFIACTHILTLFTGAVCFEKGEVIETIGSYKLTTTEFEEYYETFLEKFARTQNVDKKSIAKFICEPETSINPRVARQVAFMMDPTNTYKSMRDARMVEQVADQEGFSKKPIIKRLLEQSRLETLTRFFVQEKMEKYLKFTDEEIALKCDELRKKSPERFGVMPIDVCKQQAKRFMAEKVMQTKYNELIGNIKEGVQVTKNADFDKDGYLLERNIPAYISLKKEGGCYNSSKPADLPPANTDKKNK